MRKASRRRSVRGAGVSRPSFLAAVGGGVAGVKNCSTERKTNPRHRKPTITRKHIRTKIGEPIVIKATGVMRITIERHKRGLELVVEEIIDGQLVLSRHKLKTLTFGKEQDSISGDNLEAG